MTGNAFTVCKTLEVGKTYESIDLVCEKDVVAARLTLVSERQNGVELSHGWVVRDQDDVEQAAICRTLHTTYPRFAVHTSSSDACIIAPGAVYQHYEWIDNGVRLASTSNIQGDNQKLVAILFTAGNFAILEQNDDIDPGFEVRGEERVAHFADTLSIGGDGYRVESAVFDQVPVGGWWGLIGEGLDVGYRICTDWNVFYRPVRIEQGRQQDVLSAPVAQGGIPDLATLVTGSVDLPLGEIDNTQSGCNFGLQTATYADKATTGAGYSTLRGVNDPISQGWCTEGQGTHKTKPRSQSVVIKPYGWGLDEWRYETTSQVKANWLGALWYGPERIIPGKQP